MLESLSPRLGRESKYIRTYARVAKRFVGLRRSARRTVADAFEEQVRAHPNQVALIDGSRRFTYREFDAVANRYARWAHDQGIRRGDVVALVMSGRAEFLFAWMGILKAGGACAFINHHLEGAPLAHSLRVSGARLAIVGCEHTGAWASAASHLEQMPAAWWVRNQASEELAELPAEGNDLDEACYRMSPSPLPRKIRAEMRCEERAFFIYTSGTTGLPKAASISHFRALSMMNLFGGLLDPKVGDRIYVCLPLYHSSGGVGGVGAALTSGAAVVIRDRFSAKEFWSDIVRHRCTHFIYIGELCRYLLNTEVSPDERAHRVKACMGNGLRPEIWEQFRTRFAIPQILEFYGSSEGNVALFNADNKVGSIGCIPAALRPLMKTKLVHFDVRREEIVRGPDGRCIECAPGEVGEAIGKIAEWRPGGGFEGYSNREATEKKILTDVFERGDRWFRTGDLLRQDEDGYFYFVDRIGDTFRWKGENVATSEVAECLSTFEGILEANVYGVEVPEADGRAGMAALVVEEGFDPDGIAAHVTRGLPSYARPLFIRIMQSMDTTGTFKHRKVDLVEEGFDPARVEDPVYFRGPGEDRYRRVDADLHSRIVAGELRL